MDVDLANMVQRELGTRCSFAEQSVLRNHFFFQDEMLAEDVALPMCSFYFYGLIGRGIYGILQEVVTKEPVFDLFFFHQASTFEVLDDSTNGMYYTFIDGGDVRIPIEDPMSVDDFCSTLGTGAYKPLIDERAVLNASWIRVKPFYSIGNKDNSFDKALRNSLQHTLFFLRNYQPLNRLQIDFDYTIHEPHLFSRFLVGAHFNFADLCDGGERFVEKAREVYSMLKK